MYISMLCMLPVRSGESHTNTAAAAKYNQILEIKNHNSYYKMEWNREKGFTKPKAAPVTHATSLEWLVNVKKFSIPSKP